MPAKLPSRYTVWLTITRGCQLRCEWCYAKETGYAVRMSDDVLQRSLRMLEGLKIGTVCLIGGEPTTDSRFLKLVKELKLRGYNVSVITNGIRFADEKFLDDAIGAGIGNIIVSLKSPNGLGYLRDTGKDSYDSVLNGLRNLKTREDHVSYTLSVTLCGAMVHQFEEVCATIIKSGARNVSFDTERPIIVGNDVHYDGLAPKKTADLLVGIHPRMEALKNEGVDYYVYITHPFCLFPDWYISQLKKDGRLMSGCQIYGGTGIIIDEHGTILPCNHFCSSGLGSIDHCPTGEAYVAWRTEKQVVQFYEKMSGFPADRCVRCPHWDECGAGCRINWFKFGPRELIKQ